MGCGAKDCTLLELPVASSALKSIGGKVTDSTTGATARVEAGLPACANRAQLLKNPTALPAAINTRNLC
jgi:hypothetical protein